MKRLDQSGDGQTGTLDASPVDDPLGSLVANRVVANSAAAVPISTVVIGCLIGIAKDGRQPIVTYQGRMNDQALAARSIIDLHGAHVGRQVLLTFENGNQSKPIVIGVLQDEGDSFAREAAGQVEVDSDGARMVVSAKEQLVLRCGKARITLTRAGKVLIEGTYISSRSSGVNRIKGGSIHLN